MEKDENGDKKLSFLDVQIIRSTINVNDQLEDVFKDLQKVYTYKKLRILTFVS